MQISAVQRADVPPALIACPTEDDYEQNLRRVIREAAGNDGLTAVVVPWKTSSSACRNCSATIRRRSSARMAPAVLRRAEAHPAAGGRGLEFDHVIIPDAGAGLFPRTTTWRKTACTPR